MKARILLFLLFLFFINSVQSQSIRGIIKGVDNQPVPYATIYIDQLKTGAASNENGNYELKTGKGSFDLEFRALGFKSQKLHAEVDASDVVINATLEEQIYSIAEITVKKGDEDPAYGIMRKAISLTSYYQNQVKHYKSTYYIKVNGNFKHIPAYIKTLMKLDKTAPNISSGDVFFTESVNEVTFNAPEKYFQKVISYKTTFPENEKPQPMFIGGSFYNQRFWGGISPLALNAFSYYKFRYEGVSFEKNYSVLKIKVVPKFKGKNLFEGYIYLLDKTYSLYSVDLSVPIQYGTSYLKTQYVQVAEQAWLPASFSAYNDMKAFGANAIFHVTSSVKYAEVEVNKNQLAPKWLKRNQDEQIQIAKEEEKKLSKKEQKIQELLSKENPSKADVLKLAALIKKQAEEQDTVKKDKMIMYDNFKYEIDKNALKNDSNFWKEARPIPLIASEVKSLRIKDSLTIKPVKDTSQMDTSKAKIAVEKRPGHLKISHILTGNTWRDSLQNESKFAGIFTPALFAFNTVDGFLYGTKFQINRKIDSTGFYQIEPRLAYAFSRKTFYGKLKYSQVYSRKNIAGFDLEAGIWSRDFNQETGVPVLMNTFSSLLFRTNYQKLYKSRFISASHKTEISNGFLVKSNIEYDFRKPLENNSSYSFFYRKSRQYTSNLPQNQELNLENLQQQRALNLDVALEYTPQMHYFFNWQKDKVYAGSSWPTLNMRLRKGFVQSDFFFLSGGLAQHFKWGIASRLNISLSGGGFISKKKLHFADFYHVAAQEIPVLFTSSNADCFSLLPYYAASTSKNFKEAHVNLSSTYMALKFLPLLNLTNIREQITVDFLSTQNYPHYLETGYGWSNLPLDGTFKFVAGFDLKGNTSYGFRLIFKFKDNIVIGVDE